MGADLVLRTCEGVMYPTTTTTTTTTTPARVWHALVLACSKGDVLPAPTPLPSLRMRGPIFHARRLTAAKVEIECYSTLLGRHIFRDCRRQMCTQLCAVTVDA